MRYQTDFVIEPFKPKSASISRVHEKDNGRKHFLPQK
jgi:hypothetical protein